MTPIDFFNEVEKLREFQKLYFKTRSSLHLSAAKKQEKVIDDEIQRVNQIRNKKEQPGLFK